MKRFHFRLERLLEVRSHRERQWLARLAAASGLCSRLSRKISETGEAARGAFFIDPGKGAQLDLSLLAYRENYINRLGKEQIRLREELEAKMRKRAEVLQSYQEVSRDKKVLESLKNKRSAEYYAREKREEFKEVDDLNSSQFIRKKRGIEP